MTIWLRTGVGTRVGGWNGVALGGAVVGLGGTRVASLVAEGAAVGTDVGAAVGDSLEVALEPGAVGCSGSGVPPPGLLAAGVELLVLAGAGGPEPAPWGVNN